MLGQLPIFNLGAGPLDPATLSLTQWYNSWPSNGAGGTNAGATSLGVSGSQTCSISSSVWTTVTQNSINVLDLAGAGIHINITGQTLEDVANLAAGSLWILFNADTAAAPGGNVGNDAGLWTDVGGFAIVSYSTSGISCSLWDTAYRTNTHTAATGSWHLVQMKWDGTNLYSRTNSGAWSQVACTGPSTRGNSIRFGTNYLVNAFYDGKIANIGVSDSILTDGQFDGIKTYMNQRYALAL